MALYKFDYYYYYYYWVLITRISVSGKSPGPAGDKFPTSTNTHTV